MTNKAPDQELDDILDGIDKDEVEYENGWWETSTGAEFGAKKKQEIKALIATATQKARIERIWAMPNKWTFTIKPIKELLDSEVEGGLWCDPFAGENGSKYAQVTNDIQLGGIDALEFLNTQPSNHFDGIIYDPPYSITQARMYGKKEFSSMRYWAYCKNELARILKPGGKAICFGWSSQGLGINRGFKMQRILLVPHGGSKNDTIVTVEVKDRLTNLNREEE